MRKLLLLISAILMLAACKKKKIEHQPVSCGDIDQYLGEYYGEYFYWDTTNANPDTTYFTSITAGRASYIYNCKITFTQLIPDCYYLSEGKMTVATPLYQNSPEYTYCYFKGDSLIYYYSATFQNNPQAIIRFRGKKQ